MNVEKRSLEERVVAGMEMWEYKGTGCGNGDQKESVQWAEKDHRHKSKEDDNLKHIWEGGKEKEWGS